MTIKRETPGSETTSPTKKSNSNTPTEAPAKWTEEELKLLCSLKQQSKTYEYILVRLILRLREFMTYFPGRTNKALSRAIQRRGREVQEEFTDEKV